MPEPAEVAHCYIPCCEACGAEVDCYPDPPAPAYCEECCPDHDYQYDRDERGHICTVCGGRRPYEPMEP